MQSICSLLKDHAHRHVDLQSAAMVALAVVLPRVMSRTCHCFVVIGVVHARSETQRTPSGGMIELKRGRPDLELPQPKPQATQTKLSTRRRRV
jgi:hypothetical protein